MLKKSIILLSFTLFLSTFIHSKTYYIDATSSGGDGTTENPFDSISNAVEFLLPGDTCFITEGVYHEEVDVSNLKGTSASPIVFIAVSVNFPSSKHISL